MSWRHDHKISTYFDEATGNLRSLTWKNHLDQEDAPGDFPSNVVLSAKGVPLSAFWRRRGQLHRDSDLPAAIYFDEDGRPTMWSWHQHGELHREGGKPALIGFVDGSQTALTAVSFYRHGKPYREAGGEADVEFDPDGTAYNPEGDLVAFEGFNERWLPSPASALIMPQPFRLNNPMPQP